MCAIMNKIQGHILYLARKSLGTRCTKLIRNIAGEVFIALKLVIPANNICRENAYLL